MNNSIAIIGGGPVGAIFALLNESIASKIVLLESNSQTHTKSDKRALALSNGSKFILEKIDIWKDLEDRLTPIKTIHTSQKGTFGRSLMEAEEFEQEALGYIISYGDLITALQKKISNSKIIEALYNSEVLSFKSKEKTQSLIFKYKFEEKLLNCDLCYSNKKVLTYNKNKYGEQSLCNDCVDGKKSKKPYKECKYRKPY